MKGFRALSGELAFFPRVYADLEESDFEAYLRWDFSSDAFDSTSFLPDADDFFPSGGLKGSPWYTLPSPAATNPLLCSTRLPSPKELFFCYRTDGRPVRLSAAVFSAMIGYECLLFSSASAPRVLSSGFIDPIDVYLAFGILAGDGLSISPSGSISFRLSRLFFISSLMAFYCI